MIDEGRIREIIREEISEAMRALKVSADVYPSYDSERTEDLAAGVVASIAYDAIDRVKHATDCGYREGGLSYNCDCDLAEEWDD